MAVAPIAHAAAASLSEDGDDKERKENGFLIDFTLLEATAHSPMTRLSIERVWEQDDRDKKSAYLFDELSLVYPAPWLRNNFLESL